jgi:predicted acetyltransferase
MSQAIIVRACTAADWPAFVENLDVSFGGTMSDEHRTLWERHIDFPKLLAAEDQGTLVGTAGWVPFDMTVPGGELPVAAVTMVTVRPTHRRRGILRQMLRAQFDDLHTRGIPAATLWASEAPIYQRFGYGLGVRKGRIDATPRRCTFLGNPEPRGQLRLLSEGEALELLPPVYERARREIPGSFRRPRSWWETHKVNDTVASRRDASPLVRVAWEHGGEIEGYALYRVQAGWGADAIPTHVLDVIEALGTTPIATREIWRYLFSVDLVATVRTHRLNAEHPIFYALEDVRQLRMTTADGTWVRLIDAAAALAARTYLVAGSLTFELQDADCPWNAGVWTLEGGPEGGVLRGATTAPALRLSAAELSAMYLGTVSCTALVRAGRIEELRSGAAAQADAMFRSAVAPGCLDDF